MHIIVHGGAENDPSDRELRQKTLDEAVDAGLSEQSPVAAVESAIGLLERSPRFNAGVGGAIQSDGTVRTDAGCMTSDRSAGAACSMPGVCHAVKVARLVMERTPHVCLSGSHAVAFADDFGVKTGRDLFTDETRQRWNRHGPETDRSPRSQLEWIEQNFSGVDTVGAVAAADDRIAAATSTGGRWFALAGRVGDVSQIGSGFYCTPAGGASATGAGEDIARVTLSRRAVEFLQEGASAQSAADRAIDEFEDITGSDAGIIVCKKGGGLGSAYNTKTMQTSNGSSSNQP